MKARWIGLTALVALSIAIIAVATIWSSQRFVLRTVDYVVQNLVQASGISSNLARGLVILVTIPFFWAVAQYTRGWLGFGKLRPSLKLYTNVHGIVIVAYVSAYFLVLFAASRDSLALKWCAETPEGIRVFDDPGTDPTYGVPLTSCTSDQILVLRQGRIAVPQRIALENVERVEFFDPVTGRPRVWFARSASGAFDLFNNPGTHPQTQETLRPVSGAVVQEILDASRRQLTEKQAQEQAARAQRAIELDRIEQDKLAAEARERVARTEAAEQQFRRTYLSGTTQSSVPAVLAVDQDGRVDGRVTQILAEAVGGSTDVFKPAFVNDGLFSMAFGGDTAPLERLSLTKTQSAVVLASMERRRERSQAAGESLTKATATITMRVVRGSRSTLLVVEDTASAFNDAEATRRATDAVIQKAASRLKSGI